MTKVALQY